MTGWLSNILRVIGLNHHVASLIIFLLSWILSAVPFAGQIYLFVANLVCSFGLAFFLITLVETPFTSLEGLLRAHVAWPREFGACVQASWTTILFRCGWPSLSFYLKKRRFVFNTVFYYWELLVRGMKTKQPVCASSEVSACCPFLSCVN